MSEQSQSNSKPVVYILHGDDDFEIRGYVDRLYERMGDPGLADLNTARLDGRTASEEELRTAALAIPFLAERRLVVLTNPLARLTTPEAQAQFRTFLNSLPDTTALVLVIEDSYDHRRGWKNLSDRNWLTIWAQKAGPRAFVQAFTLPQGGEMVAWIKKKVKQMGGQIQPDAATALAGHIGSDTRQATLELDKLLLYANYERPVSLADVELLTAPGGQVNIFDMVDALAAGSKETAIRLLHRLLEDQDAMAIFPMVIRQFRLLLQAREILDENGNKETIAQELGQHPFVAEKLSKQAQRFTIQKLEGVYHRLLEIDEDQKTSQKPLELALDELVVSI